MTKYKEEEEFVYEEDKEPEDIYTEEGIEEELDEDEITAGEASFMEGFEELKKVNCRNCGKETDIEKFIEVEIDKQIYLFCSKKCAEEFQKKQRKIKQGK